MLRVREGVVVPSREPEAACEKAELSIGGVADGEDGVLLDSSNCLLDRGFSRSPPSSSLRIFWLMFAKRLWCCVWSDQANAACHAREQRLSRIRGSGVEEAGGGGETGATQDGRAAESEIYLLW